MATLTEVAVTPIIIRPCTMSNSRIATKPKAPHYTQSNVKKPSITTSSQTSSSVLQEVTNLPNSNSSKKTTSSHPSANRPSIQTPSHSNNTKPSTKTTSQKLSTVPSIASTPKSTNTFSKATEPWPSASTPVPMSSSRSFSELLKSEEALTARVAQLQQLLIQSQRQLEQKDKEIVILKEDLKEMEEDRQKSEQDWEAKTEELLSQQQERIQDINDKYLVMVSRAKLYETKLEEMMIDPLSLRPFEEAKSNIDSATTVNTVAQKRTILSLIEESADYNAKNEELTRIATHEIFRQALEKLAVPSLEELLIEAKQLCPATPSSIKSIHSTPGKRSTPSTPSAPFGNETSTLDESMNWDTNDEDENEQQPVNSPSASPRIEEHCEFSSVQIPFTHPSSNGDYNEILEENDELNDSCNTSILSTADH